VKNVSECRIFQEKGRDKYFCGSMSGKDLCLICSECVKGVRRTSYSWEFLWHNNRRSEGLSVCEAMKKLQLPRTKLKRV